MRLLWLFLALVPLHAWAQQPAPDAAFWRGVDITPERRKLVEDNMLHGAMAAELGRRMNAVLGNPGPLAAIDKASAARWWRHWMRTRPTRQAPRAICPRSASCTRSWTVTTSST